MWKKLNKPKFVLLIFAALFFVPLVTAWFMVQSKTLHLHRVNKGVLIAPPLDLGAYPLKTVDGSAFLWKNMPQAGKWMLLYFEPKTCDQRCQQVIYILHQVWVAQNKDQSNFMRGLLMTHKLGAGEQKRLADDKNYQGMLNLTISPTDAKALMADFTDKTFALSHGYIFIVDPSQRLILGYKPDASPQDLLDDLKRLMRVYHLGTVQ